MKTNLYQELLELERGSKSELVLLIILVTLGIVFMTLFLASGFLTQPSCNLYQGPTYNIRNLVVVFDLVGR